MKGFVTDGQTDRQTDGQTNQPKLLQGLRLKIASKLEDFGFTPNFWCFLAKLAHFECWISKGACRYSLRGVYIGFSQFLRFFDRGHWRPKIILEARCQWPQPFQRLIVGDPPVQIWAKSDLKQPSKWTLKFQIEITAVLWLFRGCSLVWRERPTICLSPQWNYGCSIESWGSRGPQSFFFLASWRLNGGR